MRLGLRLAWRGPKPGTPPDSQAARTGFFSGTSRVQLVRGEGRDVST